MGCYRKPASTSGRQHHDTQRRVVEDRRAHPRTVIIPDERRDLVGVRGLGNVKGFAGQGE